MNKKFYITTPIYYPSSNFHIGHCYTTVIADALARYKRLKGYDVFFLTGADEHGQKIEKKALEAGVSPQEYVDKIIENAKDLWKSLDISYDKFIRTTDAIHCDVVQKIFNKLYEQGDIYKGEYKGLYCTPCESFWTEGQLIDGKCPDCGREVFAVGEEAYFFKISKYQDWLTQYISDHPDFIQPVSRKNEMINNFIKPGLQDLCVSRTSFKWGIPVTFDNNHVIYVWIDALSNYLSALGYLTENDDNYKKYWPADLQIVGKEIIRFHTIIWPIMLKALNLPIPKQIFGHGWLLIEGNKISKSLGNYNDPRDYISEFGVDAIRYYLLREVPFGNDGNFSVEALKSRFNSDLANVLGNLVNRTLGMSYKYFDGYVNNTNCQEKIDDELKKFVLSSFEMVDKCLDNLKVADALEIIIEIFKRCNKYIDETTPWILAKDENNKDRLSSVLYNLCESIRIGAILLKPFMPSTADKILSALNTKYTTFDSLSKFGYLEDGVLLNKIEPLFLRIEK